MKKVIVISGGSDGLGKEIAKTLSIKYTVVLLAPNKEKVDKVSKELNCDYEVCDVKSYQEIETAVKKIINKYQRIGCVINNAGVWIEGELAENDYEKIKEVFEINTLGTIYLTKSVIPYMKRQKHGLIINIISQAGLIAKAKRTIYYSSKWTITGFTKSLQLELAEYGIGVTGIYPGKMNTKFFEKVGNHKEMSDAIETKDVAKTIEFILSFNNSTIFPEISIKHLRG